jgi:hypothetical protein
METETTLEDCQSYDINDPGLLSCAARIDPSVYEEYTDLPVIIQRDVLPSGVKTLLSDCDGDSSCKLISYDFQTNTGQKNATAEYMISLENTDMLNRGVFIKDGSTQPTVAIEPPGYTYSYIPVNPLHSSVTKILSPVPTANDQKSSELCARFCDTVPSCVAFNYSLLNSTCQFFSHYGQDAFSYGEASFTDVSYIKDDVTSAAGKKQPNLMYANTYLEHSGNECTSMPMCNSNLQALVNTGTAVGFGTDDLLACSYCPIKTFKAANSSFFVQDEVGQTIQFSSRDLALQSLLFKNNTNPNNIIKKDDGVTRGTRDSMMYTVQSYDTSIPFNKNILFVSESDTAYSLYEISIKETYTCFENIDVFATTNHKRSTGLRAGYIDSAGVYQQLQDGTYNLREYRDNFDVHYTSNPGWLRDHGVQVFQIPGSDNDYFHTLNGNMCYDISYEGDTICKYYCHSGYSGASFTEGVSNCPTNNQADKICSKRATLIPQKTPIQLYSLTNNLFRVSESSNTFQVEDVDYVSDGFRLKNNQTFKYVSSKQKMVSRGDKYSSEYNESIFVLSNPVSILDYLKSTFPNSKFLFQRRDGLRYTYDGTNLKVLQDIFSIFPLTFNDGCASGVNYSVSTFDPPTLCTTPPVTLPTQPPSVIDPDDYLSSIVQRTTCTEDKWIVIDIPLGFDFTTATNDTTNILTIPSSPNDFATLYLVNGITNSLSFPADSYTDESLTTYSFTFLNIPLGGTFSDGTVTITQGTNATGTGTAIARGGMVTSISNFTVSTGTFTSGNITITQQGSSTRTQTAIIASILNLRKWIQSQIIYRPFFTPGLFDIPTFLAELETNRNYANFYLEHAECITTKMGETATRLNGPLFTITDDWTTLKNTVLLYKSTLDNNHTDALNAFRNFFDTTDFISKADTIVDKHQMSLTNIRYCRRKFAEFCKKVVDHLKPSIMDEIIRQTNQYIVEAYGINEDDLRVISNFGSGGATTETVPIVTLYNDIRQNKNYFDNNVRVSTEFTSLWDYLISDNWPDYGTTIRSRLDEADKNIMPVIISYIVSLYQLYDDSYQKLLRIKGLAGPGDVPKTENTLVQQKLASVQTSLNDNILYKFPTFLDSPNFTQAMTNAIDKATFNYEQVSSADSITQLPFQTIIDKATFSYELLPSIGGITQLPFQTIIDRLTFNQLCLSGTSSSTTLEPCTPCVAGTYAAIAGLSTCQACATGYYSASGATSCSQWASCSAGSYVSTQPSVTQDRGCTSCSVGYFSSTNNAEQCTSCVSGSTSTINKTECTCTTSIPNGYYVWEVTNVCSKKCNPGYSLGNGSCTLSDCVLAGGKAFDSTSGSWTCDTTTGKYYRTDQISQDATPPCTRPNNPVYSTVNGVSYGTTDSYSSKSVTYTTTTGGLCCPSGTYYNSATGSCTTCSTCADPPSNAMLTQGGCTGSTNRTCSYACNSGFTTSGSGSSISCTCDSGKYKSSGSCVSCSTCAAAPSNATLTQGGCRRSIDRTCSYACNSGFTTSGSGSSISCTCDSGKYIDANGSCVSCITCAAAPSNATLTQGGCTGSTNRTCSYACNSGFTTSGSGSSISCTCDYGKYIDANGSCVSCKTCAAAPSNATLTQGGCTGSTDRTCSYACNSGFYAYSGSGSSIICQACAAGTYSSAGATSCTPCAGGYYSASGATYCSQWTNCDNGYYVSTQPSATQNRGCTGCGSGFYAVGPNATSCTACASCTLTETQQGKVVSGCTAGSGGMCSCPPNTTYSGMYYPATAMNPISRIVYKCWCNPGYYESTNGYGSGCTSCQSGTYQNGIGKKSCITCGSCPSGQVRSGCIGIRPGVCYTPGVTTGIGGFIGDVGGGLF